MVEPVADRPATAPTCCLARALALPENFGTHDRTCGLWRAHACSCGLDLARQVLPAAARRALAAEALLREVLRHDCALPAFRERLRRYFGAAAAPGAASRPC